VRLDDAQQDVQHGADRPRLALQENAAVLPPRSGTVPGAGA
jgi:hypothetical protein